MATGGGPNEQLRRTQEQVDDVVDIMRNNVEKVNVIFKQRRTNVRKFYEIGTRICPFWENSILEKWVRTLWWVISLWCHSIEEQILGTRTDGSHTEDGDYHWVDSPWKANEGTSLRSFKRTAIASAKIQLTNVDPDFVIMNITTIYLYLYKHSSSCVRHAVRLSVHLSVPPHVYTGEWSSRLFIRLRWNSTSL